MRKDTRHNYEYDVELDGNTAPAEVVRMVGSNKRVLEIGAGPGSITKHLYEPGKCHITALERDGEAIKKLTPYCYAVYQADLNDASWPELLNKETFDVIVAADVLEHLYNPWGTLDQMKSLLRDDGYIVISLPHAGHCAIMASLINGDFEYRDWGLLDRTHIRFFGIKNIIELFEGAGLKIVDAKFVITSPEDSEFAHQWSCLPEATQRALLKSRFSHVYQVVIKALPIERSGHSIDLMEMSAEPVKQSVSTILSFKKRIKSMARRFLSPETRLQVRRIAHLLRIRV